MRRLKRDYELRQQYLYEEQEETRTRRKRTRHSSSRLEREFLQFHSLNPHVYEALKELSLKVRRHGRSKFGIGAIWERLRWKAEFETTDVEWKLCNNHRAYYARLLMKQEPELQNFFDTRTTRST